MKTSLACKIKREIEEEKRELYILENHIERIKENLLERVPAKFSLRDIVDSVFGSIIIGMTFVMKGGVVNIALGLEVVHVVAIIIATCLILVAEIYFIAYSRVKNRYTRKVGQFLLKRLASLYIITILVTFSFVYILNLNNAEAIANQPWNVFRLVILNSFPCAIGAAVPSLLKKY